MSIAVMGAGICQLDNTMRPTAITPVRMKNKIAIRVIFSPNFLAYSVLASCFFSVSLFDGICHPTGQAIINY